MNDQKVQRDSYRDYIQSERWRAVRQRYWDSKMPKDCYVCGTAQHAGMHLHHRSYKNFGNERLMDLVPLCEPCHAAVHAAHRASNKDLWKITKQVRKRR